LRLNDRIYKRSFEETALHLAEAGVEHAIHQLVTAGDTFQGISNYALETGTFSTSVASLSSPDRREIISTGIATANPREGKVRKTVKVVVQLQPANPDAGVVIQSWEELL
jgi:hypothetical protein